VMPMWAQVVLASSVGLLFICAVFIWYIRKREKQNEPLWVNLANTVVSPEGSPDTLPPHRASSTSKPPPMPTCKPPASARTDFVPQNRVSNGREAGLELPPASD
jgi:hypothetical protein